MMPKVPFQKLTLVRLMSPPTPPPDTPQDDAIQLAHRQYLGDLVERGIILANGPIMRLDDPKFRGLSIYRVGPEEARRYAMDDPAAKAGWFEFVIDEWMIPVRPRTIADRVDLELDLTDGA